MARPRNSRWPLAALAALLLPLSTQAVAQSFDPPPVIAPLKIEPDRNKVNVTTGKTEIDVPSLGVPAAPRLHWDKVQNSAPYMRGTSSAGGEEMPPAGRNRARSSSRLAFITRTAGTPRSAAALSTIST